jgi:hypothetical protein
VLSRVENSSAISEAVRRAGGRLIVDASPNPDYFRASLEDLKKRSEIVVLAHLKTGVTPAGRLSNDGQSVVRQYEMLVGSVGWAREPRLMRNNSGRVIVEVPGGRWQLPGGEGVIEVINGPTFEADRRYILFLRPPSTRPSADGGTVYTVTGYHYEGIMPVARVSEPGDSQGKTGPLYDREYVESVFNRLRSSDPR